VEESVAMRRVLPAVLSALVLTPATANAAPVRSAIFFYPWYSNPAHDGDYTHWQQNGHAPPADVASMFFPARGAYSSSDPRVLQAQMRDIARAGVDEVVSSWWGWGSAEDERLPDVLRAAHRHRLVAAVQLEPYAGRTPATVASDLQHLRQLGIRDVYLYRAEDFPAEDWGALNLRLSGVRVFGQTNKVGFAARAGFAGFYTYDILEYGGAKFARFCRQAHAAGLLCAPSVGPGYSAFPANGDPRVKPRDDGATYDCMWRAALDAKADVVTITSYNEWGEGTQIEPAARAGRYESYDGAYGLRGRPAQRAYLARTAYWTRLARR
jgi:glycoprotein endo-alpha-1,2-mannosidase